MSSTDWMFVFIGITAIGIIGTRYFEYKALEERTYRRCN